MGALIDQPVAAGHVRCSICRLPREIVVVDALCRLAACGECGYTLRAAEIMVELANHAQGARLRAPRPTDNFDGDRNH